YAGVLGPASAAFLCGAAGAPAPPRLLVRRLVRWKVHFSRYAVAILLPFAVRGLAIAAVTTLQSESGTLLLRPAESIGRITILMVLLVPLEEIGWRGYALPIVQRRHSPLASSVILGGIWGLWHLPLVWACVGYQQSSDPWSYMVWFLATIIPISCLVTWLFNHTGESVLLTSLFHIAINAADFALILPSSTGNSVLFGTTIISTLLVGLLWRIHSVTVPSSHPTRGGTRSPRVGD
ncbi:MAG TPA: CPBP family intramembrane glutamic endopeptidase, partial [Gemmatimonadaceae bacterium]|nr:CPBP family intramembrane glutamic endopeptidase [Gemmatimonadaceae bacterium]